MTTLRRHPLADQAADALLARIGAGEWALGHKLPGETTLAAQLGVGRSTVREAIRQLAGRGILESRQGSGVFVISLDDVEDWDAVLRRAGIVSIVETRLAIESEAAALAAARRTPADLRTMRRALDRRGELIDAPIEEHVDADTAFHRAIVSAAHNEVLAELFDSLIPRVRPAMVDLLRIAPAPSVHSDHASHEELFEAIRGARAEEARSASRSHLGELRRRLADRS
ncbi:FCD domain-containing protein [Plantibacter flavus]|uniref:FadR/GntR family transcriptional regulator n=1 Tax=Plantibacter flavus TaxID=150123 RepID=UPI003F187F05